MRPPPPRPVRSELGVPRDTRRGFVLVAVLWLLVALGAVGLHASLQMRTERLAAANLVDESRARATALAGAEYARSRLSAAMLDRADELRAEARASRQRRSRTLSVDRLFRQSDPLQDPWREPDELVVPDMELGDARFELRLRDTGAALNLNAADEEMLRRFFSLGLELDYAQADRLAQTIMDWKDPDDIPRMGGAERDDYVRAGMAVLPPNRPFAELDELRHVMGMTPEIFGAAVPHLTLVGSGRINVYAAPPEVLLALPGMTRAAVEEILQLREAVDPPRNARTLIDALSPPAGAPLEEASRAFGARVTYSTDEVEIISDGRVEGSPVVSRVRVVVARSARGALVVTRELDR
jgi:general secretion pathway protein K